MTRRQLLQSAAASVFFSHQTWPALESLDPQEAEPQNEDFWLELRKSFILPTEIVCFNHVGLTATPNLVREAEFAENTRAASAPSYYVYRKQRGERDKVRTRLAKFLNAREDEIALTGNGTQGLHTTLLGWPLNPGQAIITTNHDYSRSWNALNQRHSREGTPIVEVSVPPDPISDDEYLALWEEKLKGDIGLALVCSMTYLTGHVVPYRKVIELCRAKKIPVLVDAAQSLALRPLDFAADNPDFLTACLHKWLMAPVGTGVFVVKSDNISTLWPLAPPDPSLNRQITKFEQDGTHSYAAQLSIKTAFEFHDWLGRERLSDRLFALRSRLYERIHDLPGIHFYSTLDRNRHDGMMTFGFKDKDGGALAGELLNVHKTHVTTAIHAGINAIRVSPHAFHTFEEIDKLADAIKIAKNSL